MGLMDATMSCLTSSSMKNEGKMKGFEAWSWSSGSRILIMSVFFFFHFISIHNPSYAITIDLGWYELWLPHLVDAIVYSV